MYQLLVYPITEEVNRSMSIGYSALQCTIVDSTVYYSIVYLQYTTAYYSILQYTTSISVCQSVTTTVHHTQTHLVPTAARVHLLEEVEVGPALTSVLTGLHLTVDHPRIVSLPTHMVDLRQEGCVLGGGRGSFTASSQVMISHQLTARVG